MKLSTLFSFSILFLLFFTSCSKNTELAATPTSPGNILRVEYLKYVMRDKDTIFNNSVKANIYDEDSFDFLKETQLKVTIMGRIWNLPYTGGRLDFYDYGGTEKLFSISTADILQSKFQTFTTQDETINGSLFSVDFSFVIPKTISNKIYRARVIVNSGEYSSEYMLPVKFNIN
jgi:hypothetical protein